MNNFYKILLCLSLTLNHFLVSLSAQDSLGYQYFRNYTVKYGGIERLDTSSKKIYLVFTGGDYNDGGKFIRKTLKRKKVRAHFFFTGDFYRAAENKRLIKRLLRQGHYLGPHSDKHLLYASWVNRDSLLVDQEQFTTDLLNNYKTMESYGIQKHQAPFFMPPYEWYNSQISQWTNFLGLTLINYTPGTRSNADYTTPDMGDRYISSDQIFNNIFQYESHSTSGLKGFILFIHLGTHPDRTDKLYHRLPELIDRLRERGYEFSLMTDLIK